MRSDPHPAGREWGTGFLWFVRTIGAELFDAREWGTGFLWFVRTIGAELFDAHRAARKRQARARGEAGAVDLLSYRRLDPAL